MEDPAVYSTRRQPFGDELLDLCVGPTLPVLLPDPLATMLPPEAHQRPPVEEDDDIYRGVQSPVLPGHGTNSVQFPRPPSVSSSSSSSSGGLPFSNLAQTIERAIGRWARRGRTDGNSSSSSSSSSSTSTKSSTASRSPTRRRRRKRSPSIQSYTTSLTTRRQLREASRIVPREFVLFLPPEHNSAARPPPSAFDGATHPNERNQILRTPSLKLVLTQLGTALKRNAKTQRPPRPAFASPSPKGSPKHAPVSLPSAAGKGSFDVPRVAFDVAPGAARPPRDRGPAVDHKRAKGKLREVPRQIFWQEQTRATAGMGGSQRAWWLDVASPTWDDMRALGKLLHLHPLTLEDILQKEQREKFELFPRLGYYFVVFRALERATTDPTTHLHDDESSIGKTTAQEVVDVVEATNIYFVVFKEGICTFHFEDISAHTEAVRKKLLHLEETFRVSSVWIAHDIMDSVVDSFFPVLKEIEREVEEVEGVVAGLDSDWAVDLSPRSSTVAVDSAPQMEVVINSNTSTLASEKQEVFEEKMKMRSGWRAASGTTQHIDAWLSGWKDTVWGTAKVCWLLVRHPLKRRPKPPSMRLKRLLKMTTTRRLVTTLARLLYSKSEVIAQIQKRLSGQGEVAIYLGDVQDHIITLQQSLEHYERMLSHSHPAYLAYLRAQLEAAKGQMDGALLSLTILSFIVMAMQVVPGFSSLNVQLPRSDDFTNFGIMVAISITAGCIVIGLTRFWWVRAKGRRGRLQAAK